MATEIAINNTPKVVVCGPYRYEVLYDGENAYEYGYSGVTLFRTKRIKLDSKQADTEIPQTLLHEILHALGGVYGIEEWSRHKHDQDDVDKVIDKIDLMSSALLQFIRTNPDLICWLQTQL